MKRFMLSFLAVLLLASPVRAQTISYGAGQPEESKGEISASGDYTVGLLDTVIAIRLHVKINGQDTAIRGSFDGTTKRWTVPSNATWPNGTYQVQAEMVYATGLINQQIKTTWANAATITITDSPAPGGGP